MDFFECVIVIVIVTVHCAKCGRQWFRADGAKLCSNFFTLDDPTTSVAHQTAQHQCRCPSFTSLAEVVNFPFLLPVALPWILMLVIGTKGKIVVVTCSTICNMMTLFVVIPTVSFKYWSIAATLKLDQTVLRIVPFVATCFALRCG